MKSEYLSRWVILREAGENYLLWQQNTRLGLDLKRIVGWSQRDRHRSIAENGAAGYDNIMGWDKSYTDECMTNSFNELIKDLNLLDDDCIVEVTGILVVITRPPSGWYEDEGDEDYEFIEKERAVFIGSDVDKLLELFDGLSLQEKEAAAMSAML